MPDTQTGCAKHHHLTLFYCSWCNQGFLLASCGIVLRLFIADKKFTNIYQPDMNLERFLKTCMFMPCKQLAYLLALFFLILKWSISVGGWYAGLGGIWVSWFHLASRQVHTTYSKKKRRVLYEKLLTQKLKGLCRFKDYKKKKIFKLVY